MSARWRRNKKRSKWLDIFRVVNGLKNKNAPQVSRIKNPKIERQAHPRRSGALDIHKEGTQREPKTLIDVLEDKDEIIVVAEFVGFKRETLRTHVKNQQLTLSAQASDRKYYKSLNLPKRVNPNTIRTTCKNGVLEIRLKKQTEENAIDRLAG